MTVKLPTVTRVYQNHTLNSDRWSHFRLRRDDIIIATPYKSGTTWMQVIVLHLIFQDLEPRDIDQFSPWLDSRRRPLDEVIGIFEEQTHRRAIKSHLPLDGLPYFPRAQYIFVGRDPRDVFMSMWNHYSNYKEAFLEALNALPGRVGPPFPACPADIRSFWKGWIGKGWFAWESEGYPFWSNLRHSQSWWEHRDLPNILFVHYNDLLADLEGEIARIADYLGIAVAANILRKIADVTSFDSMKRDANKVLPGMEGRFKGGPKTFIFKGTNGRWRDVLTADDLELYRAAVARELTPDCAAWLEAGGGITTR